MSDVWERHAEWWQRGFTEGADPEYTEQILPLARHWLAGSSRVLDLGCGEGQIARSASRDGAPSVVGLDRSHNQVAAAGRRGGGPRYVRGDAPMLPFASAAFDAVVACLVLEHVAEVDETIGEVARVLGEGGRFILFCNHPFIQTPGSGWIDDQFIDPPEQYWRVGAYLVEDHRFEEVDRGVKIGFHHRPLSRYVNAMADAGLFIEHMAEPSPPPGFVAQATEYEAITTIPRLLLLVARRGRSGISVSDHGRR